MKKNFWKDIKEYVVMGFVVIVIQSQVCAQSIVPSGSMMPTINVGDRLIINKLATKYKEPSRGEIIVFLREKKFPLNEYWIKRVIALPGEVVDIEDSKVYIDGVCLDEDYAMGITAAFSDGIKFPYTVPEGCYLVMGDNREHSTDGRKIGAVPKEDVTAIGAFRIYPFDEMGVLK